MKKFSSVVEGKKQEIKDFELINERNLYLEFSKKYNKKHGVSGPFDKKFKGDKKAQEKYMEELGKSWAEHKKEKGIKNKPFKKFEGKVNESKADDMAKQMIGDGGEPNYHFVTMSDDYLYENNGEETKYSKDPISAPLKIKTTHDMGNYTFGPFMNLSESKMFAESLELDEINGPRMVIISDRKEGEVYSKFLTCRMQPVWDEHITDNSSDEESEDDQDEETEDGNSEYTYGEENEEE
jgi:hypothetical protein